MIDTLDRGRRRPRRVCAKVLALAALGVSTPLLAGTKTWVGATSTWDTPGAWNQPGQPGDGDQVLIMQAGANVTYVNPSNTNALYSDLQLTGSAASAANLTVGQSALKTNQLSVGVDGKAAVTLSGTAALSVMNAAVGMTMGSSAGGNGAFTLNNSATLRVAGQMTVGEIATGTFTQTGGKVSVTPLGTFPGMLAVASNLGSTGTYAMSGGTIDSGSLQFSPYGGVAIMTQSAGTVTLTSDLSLGDVTSAVLQGQATYTHTGGSVVTPAVNVGATGRFAQAGGTLRTGQLTIDTKGGKLDLTQNMVIDYAGATPLASVRDYAKSAYAGGAWTGNGLTTSGAAKGKAVGYAEASELLGLTGNGQATWNGQTVDATSLLLRYTLAGDVDMDGKVGFSDLVKVAQSYGVADGQRRWSQGDVDYDGNIGFSDLVKVAQNYDGVVPGEAVPGATASFSADLAAAFASVPEPSGVVLVGAMAAILVGRRRRKREPIRVSTKRR